MLKLFLTEQFLWSVIIATILLLVFYCLLIFRPGKSIVQKCEEDHLRLMAKIDTAKSPAELDLLQGEIQKFTNRYYSHLPKDRLIRLTSELCWVIRDREIELKIPKSV